MVLLVKQVLSYAIGIYFVLTNNRESLSIISFIKNKYSFTVINIIKLKKSVSKI
jgi:hypothetical protein